MWNMSSQTEKVVEVSSVDPYSATPPTITTTADHDFKIGDIVKINHKTVNDNDRFRVIKIMSKNIKVVKTNVPEGRIAGEIRVSPGLLEVA